MMIKDLKNKSILIVLGFLFAATTIVYILKDKDISNVEVDLVKGRIKVECAKK